MNGSVVHFRESESNLGVMNEPQMEQNVGRENTPMISSGFNKANLVVKRASDILIALMFMVIIGFWLFPIIALLIKLDSKGPVFFKQKRHGKHNELFFCYKFRSMVVNQEADTKQATKNDARVTRVGRFIRDRKSVV